jgi:hypothetical protein
MPQEFSPSTSSKPTWNDVRPANEGLSRPNYEIGTCIKLYHGANHGWLPVTECNPQTAAFFTEATINPQFNDEFKTGTADVYCKGKFYPDLPYIRPNDSLFSPVLSRLAESHG